MHEGFRDAASSAPSTPSPTPARGAVELDPELAARLAALEQERVRREKWRAQVWRERRVLLVILALVLMLLPNFRMARVVGRSMEPRLHHGQTLLVWKSWRWFSALQPGDIIVFRYGEMELVKRVVFVQNRAGTAPWPPFVETSRGQIPVRRLLADVAAAGLDRPPTRPPFRQRSIYVLGDNINNSTDSREIGPIEPERILGKVIYIR